MFFVQPWTRARRPPGYMRNETSGRPVKSATAGKRRASAMSSATSPRTEAWAWPPPASYVACRQARTGPKARVGRTLVPRTVKATDPISAVTLKNRLSCSTGRPVRCHGWTEIRLSGVALTSAASRSSTSGRSRRTSASRKTRMSSPGGGASEGGARRAGPGLARPTLRPRRRDHHLGPTGGGDGGRAVGRLVVDHDAAVTGTQLRDERVEEEGQRGLLVARRHDDREGRPCGRVRGPGREGSGTPEEQPATAPPDQEQRRRAQRR